MRVIVAIDGSEGSRRALSLVAGMALPPGSEIRVLSALEPIVMAVPWTAAQVLEGPSLEELAREHLEEEVRGIVRDLASDDRSVVGAVVRGRPATVIAEEAATWGADLLVVGSRGLGSIGSLVLGSVSAELIDHAPCPVLVARGTAFGRVLFATDGSEPAGLAEDLLATWPVFARVELEVISVADVARPWHTGIAPTMYAMALDAYARDLDDAKANHGEIGGRAAARLSTRDRPVRSVLGAGDAAAAILEEAASWGADVIVLGSRGRTGMARLLLGSVARNVLLGASTSVLIVRDAHHGAEEAPGA